MGRTRCLLGSDSAAGTEPRVEGFSGIVAFFSDLYAVVYEVRRMASWWHGRCRLEANGWMRSPGSGRMEGSPMPDADELTGRAVALVRSLLTEQRLASSTLRRAGVSENYLVRSERRHDISLRVFLRCVEALELSPSAFFALLEEHERRRPADPGADP